MKAAVFVTAIAVGAVLLVTALGVRVARNEIDRFYEKEAHDLVDIIAAQVRRAPDDYGGANALLADIVRTQPDVERIRMFREGTAGEPRIWASSYGTDLAVDAGPEVLPPPGVSTRRTVQLEGTEMLLNTESVNLPNGVHGIAFYFDAVPRNEAIAKTRRGIIVGAVVAILAELVGLSIASYVLVLRRVKRLSRTAMAVAEGDMTSRVETTPADRFPDELTDTTHQFNRMIDAVSARTRQQDAVAELGRAGLGGEALADLLDRAAELVQEVLEADVVSVFERDPEGLMLRAERGWPEGSVLTTILPTGDRSQSGWTLQTGEPTVMLDRAKETRFRVSEQSDALGLVSGVTVAIGDPAQPFGVLAAHQRSLRVFTRDDIAFLTTVANTLGESIAQELTLAREREAEERYRLVVEHSTELITLTDPEGVVLFASPSHLRILGTGADDAVGSSMLAWVDPGEKARLSALLEQATGGAAMSLPDVRMRHSDGTAVWVDLTTAPVQDADGELLFLMHVAHDVTERRGAQEERLRLQAQLMAAQEDERQRIAIDLHDDPIQTLTAATLRLEAVRKLATEPRQQELIQRLEDTISHTVKRLRHLMFELHPPALDRDGLTPALRDYAAAIQREHGLATRFESHLAEEPNPGVRAVAYRITKEAVSNAVKHAGAGLITLTLHGGADGVRVSVRDDGSGFDPEAVERRHDHAGLDSIRERARVAGGWLRVDAAPGRGTTVEFFIPARLPEGEGEGAPPG